MASSRRGGRAASAKKKDAGEAIPTPPLPVNVPKALGLSPTDTADTVGNAVAAVQTYLQRFGYLQPAEATDLTRAREAFRVPRMARDELALPAAKDLGKMDKATEQALANFQAYYGLPLTGRPDIATVSFMSRPRCGVPDVPQIPGGGGFVARSSWGKNKLKYRFENFTNKLTPAQIQAAIRQAFRLWERVSRLEIREVRSGAAADIKLGFYTGFHRPGCQAFDGVGGVLAHAYFPGSGGFSGDTHFDDTEPWSVDVPASGTDLITVAAHELGHALGLDHSNVRGALMFAYYGGARRYLDQDDIRGIQRLYGAREEPEPNGSNGEDDDWPEDELGPRPW